jgi:predicted AlkP superfamily phosphohydrolase/phosphomutase
LSNLARTRHKLFLDLLGSGPELASVVYVGADRLSHVAWPHVERVVRGDAVSAGDHAVERYFSTLDEILGETWAASRDATFLISSDHGQGPEPPRTFAPNVWLSERGWLSLRSRSARRASHALVPASVRRKLWAWYSRSRGKGVPSPFLDRESSTVYAIPFSHTECFGLSVRGDEKLERRIAQELRDIRDPATGRAVVQEVLFRREICRGPASRLFPELVVLLDRSYGVTNRLDGPALGPTPPGPSGYHDPDGILIAAGPGVERGEHRAVPITAIAPTVLSVLGIEPLGHMESQPIEWIATTSDLRQVEPQGPPQTDVALSSEEESRVADHLRDLGYID